MTLLDLIIACLRRWPVVLLGAALTLGAAYLIRQDDGVYYTRSEIVFLAPTSEIYPNALQTRTEDVIITAGIVAKRIVGPERSLKFSSVEASLIGTSSELEGYWLRLPDTGGQWAPNFASQVLLLDIVAPSPARVSEIHDEVVEQIRSELDALQREAGVRPEDYISTTLAQPSPLIHQNRGNRTRAFGMTGVLGVAATLGAIIGLEHRARRRSGARAADEVEESSGPAEDEVATADSADTLHQAR